MDPPSSLQALIEMARALNQTGLARTQIFAPLHCNEYLVEKSNSQFVSAWHQNKGIQKLSDAQRQANDLLNWRPSLDPARVFVVPHSVNESASESPSGQSADPGILKWAAGLPGTRIFKGSSTPLQNPDFIET